jgi:hypothetical protein
MWQPLLNLLELLGRVGVHFGSQETIFSILKASEIDSLGSSRWQAYRESRRLWAAWGPPAGSTWEPFHCVTLFAAVDELKKDAPRSRLAPLAPDPLPDFVTAAPAPPGWLGSDALVIVDLDGPQSVAMSFELIRRAGCQPVCTFDNWPHEKGVLRSENVIGALLYYAAELVELRPRIGVGAPPVWICDRTRFSGSRPAPGRFDNRYIIEDRLLPGPVLLKGAGIRRVVYLSPQPEAAPPEDLRHYLDALIFKGFKIETAGIASAEAWAATQPYIRKFIKPAGWSEFSLGLMRSSAGGFGGFVPEPSSGG